MLGRQVGLPADEQFVLTTQGKERIERQSRTAGLTLLVLQPWQVMARVSRPGPWRPVRRRLPQCVEDLVKVGSRKLWPARVPGRDQSAQHPPRGGRPLSRSLVDAAIPGCRVVPAERKPDRDKCRHVTCPSRTRPPRSPGQARLSSQRQASRSCWPRRQRPAAPPPSREPEGRMRCAVAVRRRARRRSRNR